jgi:agmatine deiminase
MSLDIPAYRLPMVIDGGNILTDGKGTMIMFESVLDVNPDIDRPKLEKIVRDYFGCTRLITFPACRGDITGHIDMAVKFINEDTLMVSRAAKAFKWHEDFERIAEHLGQCKSVNGKNYTIVRVPMPQTKRASKNVWTYINSLTLNKKVIVPTFGVPEDDQALEIYRSSMPGYEIVGIDFHRYPVGSVHCQSKEIHQTVFNE